LEVLVIDDGSTDETPEICAAFQSQIRVSRSANLGFGASLTRAITEASGEYVCLLDADDYFATDKIARLTSEILKGRLFISHPNQLIRSDGTLIEGRLGDAGNTSTVCVHRAAALTLCPVDNELSFYVLSEAGHGVTLPDPLTFYRLHAGSMMRSRKPETWYRHLTEIAHSLATRLYRMADSPPFWGDSAMLHSLSNGFRSIAYCNEMEAELLAGAWGKAIGTIPSILRYSATSTHGTRLWHFRVALRGLLNKPMKFEGVQSNF